MNFVFLSIFICAVNVFLLDAVPVSLKPIKNVSLESLDKSVFVQLKEKRSDPVFVPVSLGSPAKSVFVQLKKSQSEFLSKMSKADPTEVNRVLDILEGLLSTSEGRKSHLEEALSLATVALGEASDNVVDAETAKAAADADLVAKNAVRATRETEKNDAQANHDDEIDTLNEEQQMLRDVIEILEDLLGKQAQPRCPSSYIPIGETCYSEAARHTSATNDNSCQKVDEVCTGEGAVLANKDESHVWLNNGGDRLGMTYGHTSNKNGEQYWLTSGQNGDYGWYPGDCDRTDFWFICTK